jgi:NADH:ubiquinone oxidoreductase subunit 6 (subunit J)
MGAAIFYIAGAFALGSAISVVLQRNPFLAAFSLILHFAMLAVLYLDLSSDFVAAAQVLVYAGGVMILFIFALAYLGDRAELGLDRSAFGAAAAAICCSAIFIEVVIGVYHSKSTLLGSAASVDDQFGAPATIGQVFFTNYLLSFEVISLVLLVGAVAGVALGASHLGRRRTTAGLSEKELDETPEQQRDTVGARP